ncbi:MAG: diguanylate cyclase [Desulfobulbaceae bacterium]|nr:diguanylate cyclase [Desulfobulbaceae bacterium]
MSLTTFRRKPTILIVDDDEVLRLLLRQFLEVEGYRVVEAEDGSSALLTVVDEDFDLVIMDIAMPGIDGLSVCERIKSSMEEPPPVLMITALEDEESIDRAFSAGAVDLIRKPIQWSVLRNRIRYIINAYHARREIEELTRSYEMILDAAANGICGIDDKQRVSFANPAALTMLGYEQAEMIGRPYREIFKASKPGTDDFDIDCCPFFHESTSPEPFEFDELRLLRKDGTSFSADFRSTPIVEGRKLSGAVLVFQDVTERQQAAEIIRHMANHDSLTSLPNRNFCNRRLPQAISLASREGRKICLLFIDLDRFKPINDKYGHAVGDKVLLEVATRLKEVLRASDSVCRIGGDEFVILLESSPTIEGAEYVAQRTIDILNEPIEAEGHQCSIGASVGISVYPDDCRDARTMLQHADIAMYAAKKKGRNRYEKFSPEMMNAVSE